MTGMLASVRNVREAECALQAGVDLLDLKEPDAGALGALDPGTAARIVQFINARTSVSATIGDLPFQAPALCPTIERMAATGADLIKVGVFGDVKDRASLEVLRDFCCRGLRIVLVLFAETYCDGVDFAGLSGAGITGIMLDTSDKAGGALTRKLPLGILDRFVNDARSAGLLTGLAGSLRETDIAPLLRFGPDYLGFRGALCRNGRRGAELDAGAIRRIRSLIKADAGPSAGRRKVGAREISYT